MATKQSTGKKRQPIKRGERARQIARVLVDAVFMGERESARKWGLTPRTVYNYWDALEKDPNISGFFTIEKSRREEQWAARINGPILKALDYFDRVFTDASTTDPETIQAVTQAMATLVEAKTVAGMTHESITADREATAANTTAPTYKTHDLGSNRAIAAA